MNFLKKSMQWASALSVRPSLEGAIKEVLENTRKKIQGPADLGIIFISSAFTSEYSRLMPLLREEMPASVIIGCSGGGVVGMTNHGTPKEVEGEPGLSLTLAKLPGVKVHNFHIEESQIPDLDGPPDAWIDLIGVSPNDQPQFIIFCDPYFGKINDFLEGLDYAYPGAVKVGGMASAGYSGRNIGLFSNYRLYQGGVLGVALTGNIILETIVAQGCRPIGGIYRVEEGERNVVLSLVPNEDDRPNYSSRSTTKALSPLETLRSIVQHLSDEDKELVQTSLFIGIARDQFKEELESGDFLIRNLLGVDPRVGAIAIGDRVRPGQRIQFHLRDAKTSAEDLELLLRRYQQQLAPNYSPANAGALMFSCLGRGERLYGRPNFDSELFKRYLGNIPVAGFFCNGEIGPVGGGTFLHGYTSVFGICRQSH